MNHDSASVRIPVPQTPPRPTSVPVASRMANPPVACPLVKLDFTNLTNPMARYYSQSGMLQAGDYLFDQLWWTHGVRVSARINAESDRLPSNELYIPKFTRGTGWVDSRLSHNIKDHTTGGAIRLFDTMRPTGTSDARYNQRNCRPDDGDIDLGAPNRDCPGGGPGKDLSSWLELNDSGPW